MPQLYLQPSSKRRLLLVIGYQGRSQKIKAYCFLAAQPRLMEAEQTWMRETLAFVICTLEDWFRMPDNMQLG